MRALSLFSYGPPEVLQVIDQAQPQPGTDEVLVRIHFSAVNPVDVGVRSGRILPNEAHLFPMVLGWDAAGIIESLGPGISDLSIGDRVMVMSQQVSTGIGLHAEFAALPRDMVVKLDDKVSLEMAAATPLAGITALNAVESLGLSHGSQIYINNPEGAVGRFATQIAQALGLVVLTSPSAAAVQGAIDVRGGDAAHEVFAMVEDSGAYSTVIPEWWKPGGVYLPSRGITPLVVENSPTRADLSRLAAWLADERIAPQIQAVIPLVEGAEAHRRLELPGLSHKLILDHRR